MTEQFPPEALEAFVDQAGAAPEQPAVDPETAVRTMLAVSHLAPPEAEVAGLVRGFAAARAAMRLLYAVPEVRYEEPALIFSARV